MSEPKTDWSFVEKALENSKKMPKDNKDFGARLNGLIHFMWNQFQLEPDRVRANSEYYQIYSKLADVRDLCRNMGWVEE